MKLETLYDLIAGFMNEDQKGFLSDNDGLHDLIETFFKEHCILPRVEMSFFILVLEAFSDHDSKTADGLYNLWNWAFAQLTDTFTEIFKEGVKVN